MTETSLTVQDRIDAVKSAIAAAAQDADRAPEDIVLTAVSKTFDADHIRSALAAGQRVFGENRVQETMAKWPALREAYTGVELRLIGPLQTNKAVEAVETFDVIESVDRPKLARALASAMEKTGRTPRVLVQVNTGEEDQKAGVAPTDADAFIAACRNEFRLSVDGLMCIPPADAAPAPHFGLLRVIAERNGLQTLSMGMSADFETAVRLGATHVRVGSAIFGARAVH